MCAHRKVAALHSLQLYVTCDKRARRMRPSGPWSAVSSDFVGRQTDKTSYFIKLAIWLAKATGSGTGMPSTKSA